MLYISELELEGPGAGGGRLLYYCEGRPRAARVRLYYVDRATLRPRRRQERLELLRRPLARGDLDIACGPVHGVEGRVLLQLRLVLPARRAGGLGGGDTWAADAGRYLMMPTDSPT